MSNIALNNQRLFAFCLLIKVRQKNSVVFIADNNRKIAKKFGLSLASYNKYLNRALECGLFYESGNHIQLIKVAQIAEELGIVSKGGRVMDYVRIEDISTMSFHQLTIWVRQALMLLDIAQQKYKIKQASDEIVFLENFLNRKKGELLSYSKFKRIQKKAGQFGISTEQYLQRVKKQQRTSIVTGCQHLAKKFGNCQATMNKALNDLVKKGYIKRFIEKREFKEYDISNSSFDAIKATYGTKALFINYSTQHFIQTLGSIITMEILVGSPK